MKKIYTLLALLFIMVAKASAQDTADLAIMHSITNSDTIFIDSPSAPMKYITYKFANNGPDTLAATDSMFLKTPYANYYILLSNLGGFGVGDTITVNDTTFFVSGPANGAYPWCDSIWAKRGPAVIYDPVMANNKVCNTVTIHHISHTGISENLVAGTQYRGQPVIGIYPNPAASSFNFDYSFPVSGTKATVYVRDIVGRLVAQQELGMMNGDQKVTVDVSSLSTGTYLVELKANNIRSVGKFTIQK